MNYGCIAIKNLPSIPLTLNDLHLKVRYNAGDKIERDVSCDSTYMLSTMRQVGIAMRETCYWVRNDILLYLVINHAGGHGTNECLSQYKNMLLTKFNIFIVHQVLRFPFTNVLDLGVEQRHFM